MTDGPVVLDLQALQSPDFRGRGIARYAKQFAEALERLAPDLVSRYLFDPAMPPPAEISELLETGKVGYAGAPQAMPGSARVLHALSPFELGVPIERVWPRAAHERGLRFCATVYDLIPLQYPDPYLLDPRQRTRYLGRLEILRAADALLTISNATSRVLTDLLGVPSRRVHTIGTGIDDTFRPPASRDQAGAIARTLVPGLELPFVLYPAGSDGRKNVERLIWAFARLPAEVRNAYQLVLVCHLPELAANHLRHIAAEVGIADRVLLTGYVPDETMLCLYQATELLCFPSLIEGYGLPIAEATACGAVAVVSGAEPVSDLVDPEACFDPYDPDDISRAITTGLTDKAFRSRARAKSASIRPSWDEVVRNAIDCYERLLVTRRRLWRSRRTVAVVSPFPPVPSGVAQYSANLVAEMRRQSDLEIDCFADGLDRCDAVAHAPDGIAVFDARRLSMIEAAKGGYDEVLYVFGNSEFHAAALASIRARRGLVLAHDVRLSGLYRFASRDRGAVPGGLESTVSRVYGPHLPAGIGASGEVTDVEAERYGVLLAREVIEMSELFLVTSQSAARLARLEAGPALAGRVGVVPFAVEAPAPALPAGIDRLISEIGSSAVVIASFGIVDPIKEPYRLIRAFASIAAERAEVMLAFVGPVSTVLRVEIESLAAQLGIAGQVLVTGRVERASYSAWLARSKVAVQLRATNSGEASGAVGDCLSSGVPTIVSDVGWLGELPDSTVRKLPPRGSDRDLAAAISDLLDDRRARATLSTAGRDYASSHSFQAAARAMLDLLDLRNALAS